MSEFGIEFKWCGYEHRADAVMEDAGDGDFYLTSLEYLHPLLPEERGQYGGKKAVWLNVSYLLDTDAVESIWKAAAEVALDQYEDHCKEDYTTPEDYE
jgi:hypothetical protein